MDEKFAARMTTTREDDTTRQQARFARLMRLGNVAYAQGDPRQAHRLWRAAAMIQPDSEEVWLALFQVLEREDDRRVCLQNILAINPNNQFAQRELENYLGDTQPSMSSPALKMIRRRIHWRRILLWAIAIPVIAFQIAALIIVFQMYFL